MDAPGPKGAQGAGLHLIGRGTGGRLHGRPQKRLLTVGTAVVTQTGAVTKWLGGHLEAGRSRWAALTSTPEEDGGRPLPSLNYQQKGHAYRLSRVL